MDVRTVVASDREEVGKGAGKGWGDAQIRCAGRKQMEGGESLAESSSSGLFLPWVYHNHHLQRL